MPDIEERHRGIEERNTRVEIDKAWETSWTRRGLIAGNYLCLRLYSFEYPRP